MPKGPLTMAVEPVRPPETPSDLVVWAERQIVKSTCGLCGASTEAPAAEARAWFAAHRTTAHPELPPPEPRRSRREPRNR
jgi:hypothetical protein